MFCNRQQPSAVRNPSPAVATRDAAFQQPTMYSFEVLAGNLGLPTNDTFETQPWGFWGTTGAFSYKALAPNWQLAHLKICSVPECREETTKGRNKSETACYNRQFSTVPTQRHFTAKNTAKNLTRFFSSTATAQNHRNWRRRSTNKQRRITFKSSPLCTQVGNVWKNMTLSSSLGRTEKGRRGKL